MSPILSRFWLPKLIQNDSKMEPKFASGRPWGTLWVPRAPKSAQWTPRSLKIEPKRPQNGAQDTSKAPKMVPWEPPRAPKMNPKDSLGTEMDANRQKDSHKHSQTDPIRNFRPQLNGIWDQLSWIPSHLSSIRSQLVRIRIKLTRFRIQRSRFQIQLKKNSNSTVQNSNSAGWS